MVSVGKNALLTWRILVVIVILVSYLIKLKFQDNNVAWYSETFK